MKWTFNKPNQEGYYWVKYKTKGCTPFTVKAKYINNILYVYMNSEYENVNTEYFDNYMFSDKPIELPEEEVYGTKLTCPYCKSTDCFKATGECEVLINTDCEILGWAKPIVNFESHIKCNNCNYSNDISLFIKASEENR